MLSMFEAVLEAAEVVKAVWHNHGLSVENGHEVVLKEEEDIISSKLNFVVVVGHQQSRSPQRLPV